MAYLWQIGYIKTPTLLAFILICGLFHFKNFMLYVLISAIFRVWTLDFWYLHFLRWVSCHSKRNISIICFSKDIMRMISCFFWFTVSELVSHLKLWRFLLSLCYFNHFLLDLAPPSELFVFKWFLSLPTYYLEHNRPTSRNGSNKSLTIHLITK